MGLWGDVGTNLILQARGGNLLLRWVGGVYCGGRLECGGKLIEEVAGPRGVYFGGRLGAWESLVAEIDG
ncbi:hypothetical protein CA596_29625, partial [Paenibacillus odorifer]